MEPQRLVNLLSLQPMVFTYLLSVWKGGQVLHGVGEEGLQGYKDPSFSCGPEGLRSPCILA